jgi:pimeloyl-ACP methyl ester carboxylesterase
VLAHGTGAVAERVLERWFTEGTRRDDTATVSRFRAMLEAVPPEGYAACCEALARWDARADLGAVSTPTLVVAGANDVATPPSDAVFLAEAIPGAQLTVIPGAAHLANVEQPERFDAALLGFLSTTSTEEAA